MMLGAHEFTGDWTLRRVIKDHLAGQDGTLVGQARFAPLGQNQLDYHEHGTLTLDGGAQMAASRRYLWAFAAGRVDVAFEDGAAFHSFVPNGHAAGTDHPCGADFYTVRYDFTAWPAWSAVWTVTGPRKNYVSSTYYARISVEHPI